MVDIIGDPLVHMIGNAVDHGIELPSDRVARGKPQQCTVRLAAYHAGGNVVLGNVVCGNALPLMAGREVVFRLSPPCVLAAEPCWETAAAQTRIGLEQGRADVFLFVQE
jgi:hypothetical protein